MSDIMEKNKKLGYISITVPVLTSSKIQQGAPFEIEEDALRFKGFYGDSGKGKAMAETYGYAKQHNLFLDMLTAHVQLSDRTVAYQRIGVNDMYGIPMLNLAPASQQMKLDAREHLCEILLEEARRRLGSRAGMRGATEWLSSMPSIADAIFRELPDLMVIVANIEVPPVPGQHNVAILRNTDIVVKTGLMIANKSPITIKKTRRVDLSVIEGGKVAA